MKRHYSEEDMQVVNECKHSRQHKFKARQSLADLIGKDIQNGYLGTFQVLVLGPDQLIQETRKAGQNSKVC
jgi:hypothetical protein